MDRSYSDPVMDHFRNPRNVGRMEEADACGRAENPANGASLELYLSLEEGRVSRAAFRAQGCTATIAAGSMATELLPGRKLEPGALSREELEAALGGLPATKKHATALVAQALAAAARTTAPA